MKISTLIFFALVFLIIFKYTKIFQVNIYLIIGVFILWFISIYIQTHLKNKNRNTPRPVYITNQN